MNKILRTVVIAGVFAALIVSSKVFAKEAPEKLLAVLPAGIGSFMGSDINVYEDKTWGAERMYNSFDTAIAITVYAYDLGVDKIEDGIDSEIIKTAKDDVLTELKQTEEAGMYKDVKVISDTTEDVLLPNGKKLKVIWVNYSFDLINLQGGENFHTESSTHMVGLKGQICKIRTSWPVNSSEEAKKAKEEAIHTIISALHG